MSGGRSASRLSASRGGIKMASNSSACLAPSSPQSHTPHTDSQAPTTTLLLLRPTRINGDPVGRPLLARATPAGRTHAHTRGASDNFWLETTRGAGDGTQFDSERSYQLVIMIDWPVQSGEEPPDSIRFGSADVRLLPLGFPCSGCLQALKPLFERSHSVAGGCEVVSKASHSQTKPSLLSLTSLAPHLANAAPRRDARGSLRAPPALYADVFALRFLRRRRRHRHRRQRRHRLRHSRRS